MSHGVIADVVVVYYFLQDHNIEYSTAISVVSDSIDRVDFLHRNEVEENKTPFSLFFKGQRITGAFTTMWCDP